MGLVVSNEIKIFLIFCISGIIIGILFDIFRVIRRTFKISDIHTLIEDIIFGIISALFLIFVIFIYNNGEVRWYMFAGIFTGCGIYLATISKYFIRINVFILSTLKKTLYNTIKIVFWPIKHILIFLRKHLNKPFMLLVFNIKKINNILIYKKCKKKKNFSSPKKDFSL